VWRSEAEAFSGSMVEFIDSERDLFRGNGIEGHLLRKELPKQDILDRLLQPLLHC
jgi:hypothetical protein